MIPRPITPALTLAAILMALFPYQSLAARAPETVDAPEFWSNIAVVVARITKPVTARPNWQFHADILQTVSTTFAIPASLDIHYALGGDNDLKPVDSEGIALLCIIRRDNQWTLPIHQISFMPSNIAVSMLTGENDPQIDKVRDLAQQLQKSIQDRQAKVAIEKVTQRFQQDLDDYNDYWKTNALVIARVTQPDIQKSPQVEIKSVMFAPQISPPLDKPLILKAFPDYLAKHAARGQWVILLLANSDQGWAINTQHVAPVFMPNATAAIEVKDDQDPQINQILKSVQSWQQQILNPAPTTQPSAPAPASAPQPRSN